MPGFRVALAANDFPVAFLAAEFVKGFRLRLVPAIATVEKLETVIEEKLEVAVEELEFRQYRIA